jgi:signal transduction histidine kinase/CheY-like chemotaxis protein
MSVDLPASCAPAPPPVLPSLPQNAAPRWNGWPARLLAGVAWLGNAPAPLRFSLAAVFFGVALAGRFALNDLLPPTGFPFLTFFPATLLAAALTGLAPAVMVSVASVIAAWYYFMGPVGAFPTTTPDLIAVAFFTAILLVDCLVIHALKSALQQVSLSGRLYRQSQAELLEREASLRAADRQKDVFLATLAHELRNPLAPIRTAAELVRRRAGSDPALQQAGAVVERQVLHLSQLVDDLLDVSRLTRDSIELRREVLDLRDVVDHAIETTQPAISAAGLQLRRHTGNQPLMVFGDALRLGQCVTNLLTNAAKFTPRGGRLDVQLSQVAGRARLEVSDTGVGIDPDSLERIFELFVQEQSSGLGGHSGLGLGLALTRKLVLLHGGSVVAFSGGQGQGSRFVIELPLTTVAPAATAQPAPPAALPPGPSAGARVLLIEDNEDAATLLAQLLEYSGHSVRVAHLGATALTMATQEMPDIVLLDIGLPDHDGYEVCRRLRALPSGTQPCIVALTGWGADHERNRALQAGCDAHLTKPVAPDTLLALLDRLRAARPEPGRVAA